MTNSNAMIKNLNPCNKDKEPYTIQTIQLPQNLLNMVRMKHSEFCVFFILLLIHTFWARKEPRKTIRTVTVNGDEEVEIIVENTSETDR